MYYFISILFLPIWNTVLCVIIEFSSYSFLFDFLLRWISLFYKIKVCFSFCSSSSHEIFTLFMLSSYFHVRIVTFMLSIRFLSSCVIYREAISRFDGTEDWFHFARLWMLLLFACSAHMWPCGRSNSLGMATGCGNSGTGGRTEDQAWSRKILFVDFCVPFYFCLIQFCFLHMDQKSSDTDNEKTTYC